MDTHAIRNREHAGTEQENCCMDIDLRLKKPHFDLVHELGSKQLIELPSCFTYTFGPVTQQSTLYIAAVRYGYT